MGGMARHIYICIYICSQEVLCNGRGSDGRRTKPPERSAKPSEIPSGSSTSCDGLSAVVSSASPPLPSAASAPVSRPPPAATSTPVPGCKLGVRGERGDRGVRGATPGAAAAVHAPPRLARDGLKRASGKLRTRRPEGGRFPPRVGAKGGGPALPTPRRRASDTRPARPRGRRGGGGGRAPPTGRGGSHTQIVFSCTPPRGPARLPADRVL